MSLPTFIPNTSGPGGEVGLKRRFAPAVMPWSFGAAVFLMSVLDFSGGGNAREFSEWLGSVRRCKA